MALALTLSALSVVWGGASATAVNAPLSVVVSANPVDNTPTVNNGRVVAIVELGNTVVVAGTFTSVTDLVANQTLTRTNIFAYDKTTLRVSTTFVPVLDDAVTAMVAGPDGQSVIVAGKFVSVNRVKRPRIVKLALANGAINTRFAASVLGGTAQMGAPQTMVIRGNDLYVGGGFVMLSGRPRLGLGVVDATTGAVLPWLNLPVTHPRGGTAAWVLKLDVSANESHLVLIGNFLTVGGFSRNQLAVVNLSKHVSTVSPWVTQDFVGACGSRFDTYLRSVDISFDGSYFVVAGTGGPKAPPALCDSASRWSLAVTGPNQHPAWVDYTGGDTFSAVAVTPAAVYLGGHQRWGNNPYGTDSASAGAVSRPGLMAVDPGTGVPLDWNPTRDRGVGVFALVATATTLYVGDDTDNIGGEYHPRLAEFPITGGATNPAPVATALPVVLQRPQGDGSLLGTNFDGAHFADAGVTQPAGGAIDWSQVRGSFYEGGFLYYEYSDSSFYKVSFDGATFGTPVNLTATAGYVALPSHFDNTITALAYANGRIYYMRSGDDRIFWRWFSLESDVVGAEEKVAYGSPTADINGLEMVAGTMYATTTTNQLFALPTSAVGSVYWNHRVLVDDGTVSGVQWGSEGDLFAAPVPAPVPTTVTTSTTVAAPDTTSTTVAAPDTTSTTVLPPG